MDADALVALLDADPPATVLCLDFDGTLSPIVDDPAAARAVPGAVDELERLTTRLARVAIVSGRPLDFLVANVGPGVELSALYGLQSRRDGVVADHPEAARWRDVVARVVADAGADAGIGEGVAVEDKGLSLTVHHRRAPERAGEVRAWADAVAERTGLETRPAKASIELHPPVAIDKGTAVTELAQGLRTVVYVGDDVGDLPAFRALDDLAAHGATTAKVAVATTDLPDEVRDTADLVLDSPEAVVALLRRVGSA